MHGSFTQNASVIYITSLMDKTITNFYFYQFDVGVKNNSFVSDISEFNIVFTLKFN